MRLVIAKPDTEWMVGEHSLTIVNPDGQRATRSFSVPESPFVLQLDNAANLPSHQAAGTKAVVSVRVHDTAGVSALGGEVAFTVRSDEGSIVGVPISQSFTQKVTAAGVAQVIWQLPTTTKRCELVVTAREANGRPVRGSPLTVAITTI
jgi:hypothetical protein